MRLNFYEGIRAQIVRSICIVVNAATHFDKLGIKFVERSDPDFSSYKSALKVVVRGAEQRKVSLGGIVFDGSIRASFNQRFLLRN